jgi:hypothetical protein
MQKNFSVQKNFSAEEFHPIPESRRVARDDFPHVFPETGAVAATKNAGPRPFASTSHAIGLTAFLLYAWQKKWFVVAGHRFADLCAGSNHCL